MIPCRKCKLSIIRRYKGFSDNYPLVEVTCELDGKVVPERIAAGGLIECERFINNNSNLEQDNNRMYEELLRTMTRGLYDTDLARRIKEKEKDIPEV